MRRLRIVFVLLGTVLLAVLGLVVDRAFRRVAEERTMRHRALADRVVDEMERELSTWLRREEDRPYSHYRYFYVPEDSPPQLINLVRSPLSSPPREPFLVCYFEIDPRGGVSSPLWPDNEQLALTIGFQPSDEVREFVDLVGEAVGDFWSSLTPEPAVRRAGADDAAGRTIVLEEPEGKAPMQKAPAAIEQELKSKDEALLASLNRGARERRERTAKVEPSQKANVYNYLQKEANVLQEAVQSQAEQQISQDSRSAGEPLPTTPEIEEGIDETLQTGDAETVDVRLVPMVGRLATRDHLVLYRTVSIGDEQSVQGMVLDVRTLVDWVAARVLPSEAELAARARVALAGSVSDRSVWSGTYRYRHRFAAPFGDVAADVFLDPLPEKRGVVNLTSLSLLLAFAATFGLFALYRMVAVVVAYSERRNNFVSAVTHELKTPLTAIRMYGEMLRDGVVPEEGKRQQYYEIMTAETERLTRLVQNVLELSRLEQKSRTVKMVAGDVVPVAEEVLDVLRPHAEAEGFSLELTAEPGLPQARFDRDALVQVLFNLVDNALKYSSRAPRKEILLSCRRRGDGVALAVADRGPGVGRAHLKKIFEPFYRAENELTRRSKGTGIGLALVRGLVETMGGSVTGRNAEGGGFEVEVRLAAA